MVPSVKVFFQEVRAAYAEAAMRLGLDGPEEAEDVIPVSSYRLAEEELRMGSHRNWAPCT